LVSPAFVSWHKTCFKSKRVGGASLIVSEFVLSTLFIICLIILGGFAFLKVVKRRFDDW